MASWKRWLPIGSSLGLFIAWTAATYLLEGRLLTFQRPEAGTLRLSYTVVANIVLGTVGVMVLVRLLLGTGRVSRPRFYGILGPGRVFLGIVLGLILGVFFFALQSWPSRNPVLFLNAYAQVLVVSTAEVLVCWVLLGGAIADSGRPSITLPAAVIVSALAFGVYHYGHSPPFNTLGMVGFLTVIGLVTGIFYFSTRSIYGTILFHNFLGTKGVIDALAARDALDSFFVPKPSLIITALVGLAVLVLLDLFVVRPAAAVGGES